MTKVLENPDSLTEEEIHAEIRQGVISLKINPVVCGTAFKNKGIQPFLDAVVRWMPSPLDRGTIKGTNMRTDEEMSLEPETTLHWLLLHLKSCPTLMSED